MNVFNVIKEYYFWFKKRFFPLRLTILILILLSPILERAIYPHPSGKYYYTMIQELVWIACEAIRAGTDQRVASAILKYNRVQDIKTFSRQLADHPEKITDTEQEELEKSPSKRNQCIIYYAAQKRNIPGTELNYEAYRRALFYKSQQQMETEFAPKWQEVYDDIAAASFNFTKWQNYFRAVLLIPNCIFNARWEIVLSIFIISANISFLICRNPQKWYHRWAAAMLPLLITETYRIKNSIFPFPYFLNEVYSGSFECCLNIISYMCYMLAAGLLGVQWSKNGYEMNKVFIGVGITFLAFIPLEAVYQIINCLYMDVLSPYFIIKSTFNGYSIAFITIGLPLLLIGLYIRFFRKKSAAVISPKASLDN